MGRGAAREKREVELRLKGKSKREPGEARGSGKGEREPRQGGRAGLGEGGGNGGRRNIRRGNPMPEFRFRKTPRVKFQNKDVPKLGLFAP